jgi:hypothetical protein
VNWRRAIVARDRLRFLAPLFLGRGFDQFGLGPILETTAGFQKMLRFSQARSNLRGGLLSNRCAVIAGSTEEVFLPEIYGTNDAERIAGH